jgi:hypothetical protein
MFRFASFPPPQPDHDYLTLGMNQPSLEECSIEWPVGVYGANCM